MIIYEGKCPFCHRTVRIPKAEEVQFKMIMPQDEMEAEIKLLKKSLADNDWIACADKLPETTEIVEVACWMAGDWGGWWFDHFWHTQSMKNVPNPEWVKKGGVSHMEPIYWRYIKPMPIPPKENK